MRKKASLSCMFIIVFGVLTVSAGDMDFTSLPISSGAGNAIHPSVAVSADGHVMAVWWNEATNRIMARIYSIGGGMSDIIEIPGQTLPSTWPRVRGGAGGEFHVVWSAGFYDHAHDIQYSHYNGSFFSPALTLHETYSMWPDICYNPSTNIVSVCWELFYGGLQGEIMVRQRINGNWGNTVSASLTPYYSGRSHIVTDNAGNLYLTWMEKTGGDNHIYEAYYNRTVNGIWQSPVNISNDGSMRVLPNLAVKLDGTEVVVQWYNLTDHYHWGRVITYNGSTPTYGTSQRIAQGSFDHLHYYTGMVYYDNTLYLTFIDYANKVCVKNFEGGSNWGQGVTLDMTNCPRTPDIAQFTNQGLGVVWCNMCDTPDTVYFAYSSGLNKSITITSPNGGELWSMGTNQNITWTVNNISGNLIFELLQNDVVAGVIDASVPAASGGYSWTVGRLGNGTYVTGSNIKIRIRTPDGSSMATLPL